ncbi:hypothetical protein AAVH_03226 [Aphelenchoides avenae]|nr:hypothetical protein AAVH_03226 [Aphelenchus avenae]
MGGTVTHENTTVDARDKTCGTKDGTPEEQKDNSNYAMAGGKVNPSVSVKRKKMKPKTLSEEQDPFDKPDKLAISKTEDADPVPSLYPKHA